MANRDLPPAQGLYDPRFEHDACGVGFVVDMQGRKTRTLVDQRAHGAVQPQPPWRGRRRARHGRRGRDPRADARRACTERCCRSSCRPDGAYATGIAFIPKDDVEGIVTKVEKVLADEGFSVLGWRDVPIGADVPGASAREVLPAFQQVFVTKDDLAGDELERHVYVARKRIEHGTDAYFPSLSARVVVYKGMLTPDQLEPFYADLQRRAVGVRPVPRALALQHQHVPVVAARAPVPHARPQRRDQHRAGQRELDARP